MTPDALLLDPCGVEVSVAAAGESTPAAACGGGDYPVTWESTRVHSEGGEPLSE